MNEKKYLLRVTRSSTQTHFQIIEYSVYDFKEVDDLAEHVDKLYQDEDFLYENVGVDFKNVFTFACEGVTPHEADVYIEIANDSELSMETRAGWQKDLIEFCPDGWEDGITCKKIIR